MYKKLFLVKLICQPILLYKYTLWYIYTSIEIVYVDISNKVSSINFNKIFNVCRKYKILCTY